MAVGSHLLGNFLGVDLRTTCFLHLIQPSLNQFPIIKSDLHGQIVFSDLSRQNSHQLNLSLLRQFLVLQFL